MAKPAGRHQNELDGICGEFIPGPILSPGRAPAAKPHVAFALSHFSAMALVAAGTGVWARIFLKGQELFHLRLLNAEGNARTSGNSPKVNLPKVGCQKQTSPSFLSGL